uniref:B box-type domain-containing protein n=1 Tax=Leersia perrieri TaxID=77586 RepID=A0A0D9VRF6_9ORYZ
MLPFRSTFIPPSNKLKDKEITTEQKVSSVSKGSGAGNNEHSKLPPPRALPGVEQETPEWLRVLLQTGFWGQCKQHWDATSRAEAKCLFCLSCYQVLCQRCKHDEPGHRVLKVRRYMYRSVVLAKELQDLNVDVSRIQTYIVNGQKGVHLRPMRRSPQFKPHAETPRCSSCLCWLRSAPNIFCSLSCKFGIDVSQDDFSGSEAERRHKQVLGNVLESPPHQSTPRPIDASLVGDEDVIMPEAECVQVQTNVTESASSAVGDANDSIMPEATKINVGIPSLRRRARKQAAPHRAPFF